jgi:glutathione S-transferase
LFGVVGFYFFIRDRRYLRNRVSPTDHSPAPPAARAAVDWGLDAWSTQFRGTLFPAERIALMAKPIDDGGSRPEDADPAELAAAIEAVKPKLDIMESFVADNGTVVGSFTLADIAFAPVLWRWYKMPLSFDPWPKVALLRDTVTARPAFSAMEPR